MADISMKTKDENTLLTLLGRLSRFLTTLTSWAGALVLFINVLVVFASVIWRYALHSPIHWAEEVARALMIALVFLVLRPRRAEADTSVSICSYASCLKAFALTLSMPVVGSCFWSPSGWWFPVMIWSRQHDCKPPRRACRRPSTLSRC